MPRLKPLSAAYVSAGAEGRTYAVAMGALVRRFRADRGMARDDLANRLLVSTSTLQRMEQGDPSVALGFYLGACRLLGLPLLAIEVDLDLAMRAGKLSDKPRARRKRVDLFK